MSHVNRPSSTSQQPSSVFEELMRLDMETWRGVVASVNDPVAARLIVETLDAHPQLKERRIGAYLAARVTVQRSRIVYARARAAGARVALVLGLLRRLFGGERRKAEHVDAGSAQARPVWRAPASDCEAARACGLSLVQMPEGLTFPPIVFPETLDAATLH